MDKMSSMEDLSLLLGENYLARCQQLFNDLLVSLLTNGQLQLAPNQQQQQQQLQSSPTVEEDSNSPMPPNSVLQLLQHLQENQDLQQLRQRQREQYLRQQQQQQQSDNILFQTIQQSPSIRDHNHLHRHQQQQAANSLQARLCDPAVSSPRHQQNNHNRHNYNNHYQTHNHHAHHLSSQQHHQVSSGAGGGGGTGAGSLPSSTLLAKLTAATSRPNAQFVTTTKLDQTMIEFLEAIYAINDNPEPAAIDMLSKRLNTTSEAISDWFDETRFKLNPSAGPRSPPAKKRQGGRVVTFSEYQRSLLEAIFEENNYLHPQEYEELSNLIQVPSRNIKIWFKNRRSKQRLSGRVNTPGSMNNSD